MFNTNASVARKAKPLHEALQNEKVIDPHPNVECIYF